jgi:hypothetical protein
MKATITFLLGSLISVTLQAEVPHQFQAGSRAVAAEVNENFNALDDANNGLRSAVEELQAQLTELQERLDAIQLPRRYVLVDSSQQVVGPVFQFNLDDDGHEAFVELDVPTSTGTAKVIHLFNAGGVEDIRGNELYFETATCTGIPHIRWKGTDFPGFVSPSHVNEITGDIYVADGPPVEGFTPGSALDDSGGCVDLSGSGFGGDDVFYPAEISTNLFDTFSPPFDVIEQ